MPRAIWKGAISFGLVTIPIKLHSAIEEKTFRFNQLHEKDKGRIRYKRFCNVCEQEVPFDEIVRGYEFEKDNYVILTDEELDAGLGNTRRIDILTFVPREQLDSIYFQRSYYLSPESVGTKAYKLMAQALTDDDRVAIATVAFRDKEHLATLRVRDGVFVLETMYWPDEIRAASFDEPDEEVEIRDEEIKMARALIDNMTADWSPKAYKDQYREKIEALVEQKIAGKEIEVVEEAETATVVDLIAALKASVDATAGRKVDKETGEIQSA
ncbi:MAG TPA: Ku protein [Actinomycetota bacterium]